MGTDVRALQRKALVQLYVVDAPLSVFTSDISRGHSCRNYCSVFRLTYGWLPSCQPDKVSRAQFPQRYNSLALYDSYVYCLYGV